MGRRKRRSAWEELQHTYIPLQQLSFEYFQDFVMNGNAAPSEHILRDDTCKKAVEIFNSL